MLNRSERVAGWENSYLTNSPSRSELFLLLLLFSSLSSWVGEWFFADSCEWEVKAQNINSLSWGLFFPVPLDQQPFLNLKQPGLAGPTSCCFIPKLTFRCNRFWSQSTAARPWGAGLGDLDLLSPCPDTRLAVSTSYRLPPQKPACSSLSVPWEERRRGNRR